MIRNRVKLFFWVLRWIKPYKFTGIIVILISLLVAGIELMMPMYIGHIIDTIIPVKDFNKLLPSLTILAGVLFIANYLSTLCSKLERIVQEQISRDLHVELLDHLYHLGIPYSEKVSKGGMLNLFNTELPAIKKFYSQIPSLISNIFFLVVALIYMSIVNWYMVLVIPPTVLLYYLFVPRFQRKFASSSKKVVENRASYNKKVYESITANQDLRVNAGAFWNIETVIASLEAFKEASIRQLLYGNLRGLIRIMTTSFGTILLITAAAYLVQSGQLTLGGFIALLFYFSRVITNIAEIVNITMNQKIILDQVEIVYNCLSVPKENRYEDTSKPLEEINGEIRFNNVWFKYNDQYVLKGVNINIKSGSKVAIVGKSGHGKSTILKLASGFYKPQKGEVLIDSTPIRRMQYSKLRESMGYVMQEPFLFNKTVKENITLGKTIPTHEEIVEAAKAAHAHEFIIELPEGYDTNVGERAYQLSGGQKQRIALARAFLQNPAIILLDECTSALDNLLDKEVKNALSAMTQKTIVAIMHRLTHLEVFDQIIVLDNGKVVEVGTYNQLLEMEGVFCFMFNKQS